MSYLFKMRLNFKVNLINFFYNFRYVSARHKNTFYVTTPIFYVNADPHIGHLYSAVIADTICRYKRLVQQDTFIYLTTGTDEHGSKVQQAAAYNKLPLPQYCDSISRSYREIFDLANIAYTDFIRTTEGRHKNAVNHFWNQLKTRGHIYSSQYSGWYCVSDEAFLSNSQIWEDSVSGLRFSLESNNPVEWTSEQNYMFGLSKLQHEILYWIKQGGRVLPIKFEKILLDMLQEPMPDVSISRPRERVHWAISVPDNKSQTIYVWLDALINYLTSSGYPELKFKSLWPPNIQVIGKDILKFHGIYWPAFLIAAGLEPPNQLFVHSHWTVEGHKMSKSKNNHINPKEAAKIFSMEGLRYFLLREGVAHNDSNYSNKKALNILNSELADTLGNLLSRVCSKSINPKQIYPSFHLTHFDQIMQLDSAKHLSNSLLELGEKCRKHYNENNFYLVVDTVMKTLRTTNIFFESLRPWELKSTDSKLLDTENSLRLETIVAMTMDCLRICGIVLQPIIPEMSQRLLNKLKVPIDQRFWSYTNNNFARKPDHKECALNTQFDTVTFRRILLPTNIF